jgi:hypothetical protein
MTMAAATKSKAAKPKAASGNKLTKDIRAANLPKRGPGRPPGSVNFATKALKDMILGALDGVGGQNYLMLQARKNPTAFLTLIGKVLPTTLQGDPNAPLNTSLEVRFVGARHDD